MGGIHKAAEALFMDDSIRSNKAKVKAQAQTVEVLAELVREQRNTNVLLWALLSPAQREAVAPQLVHGDTPH